MHCAAVHTVIPQRDVEVAGESRLGQLQPATEFLQAAQERKAEGRGGRRSGLGHFGSYDLDDLLFGGLGLRSFLLFKIRKV